MRTQHMVLKIRTMTVGVLVLLLVCSCGTGTDGTIETETQTESNMQDITYYDMEFHRGGRDARPENTLYSFAYAIEHGATTIECDMQMTKDGEIVLSHNPCLNPDITTDSSGTYVVANQYWIHDMTLQELQSFNVGHIDPETEYYSLHGATQVSTDAVIPTLRQLFDLVKASGNEQIRMSIEAKYYADPQLGLAYDKNPDADEFLNAFDRLVTEFGFEQRVILQCFDWSLLVRMKEINPSIETIALYNEQPSWQSADATTLWLDRQEPSVWLGGLNIHDFDDDPVKAAASLGIDNVSPYYEEITQQQVEEAHALGMKVIPWTVNSEQDMKTLYDMGVDGMITDRPWVLRAFLETMGESLYPLRSDYGEYHLEPDHMETDDTNDKHGMDAAY